MPLHRTYRGRVVYDRRLHHFSLRDIERILASISEDKKNEGPRSILDWVSKFFEMVDKFLLSRILALVGAEKFADALYDFLFRLFKYLLSIRPPTAEEELLIEEYFQLRGERIDYSKIIS